MSYPNDRRKNPVEAEEVLSPEYLAMLIASGGEVGAGNRGAAPSSEPERRHQRRKSDLEGLEGNGPDASGTS